MDKKENNYAFIDSQNLNLGVRILETKKFERICSVGLKEKQNRPRKTESGFALPLITHSRGIFRTSSSAELVAGDAV